MANRDQADEEAREVNKYEARVLEISPEGAEVFDLSMREKSSGWRGVLDLVLPGAGTTRTLTEMAAGTYLVGSGESWQVCKIRRDMSAEWFDVSDSLRTAASRKEFVHDGLVYRVARQVS